MPCLIETKQDMIAGLFKGVGSNVDYKMMNRFIIEGTSLIAADTTNQILISKIISDKLNIKSGKKIIVSFIKDNVKLKRVFLIKGIYNTGLEEYDKRFIIGQASILQELLNWTANQYSGIEVFAENSSDIKIINDFIYTNILPSSIYSETVEEKFPNIFEWLKLQDINEKVIFQLMGVVAMINLITVLLILILERTKMVGILKSIGASNWTIRSVFIFQAGFILLIGLLLGNLFGLGFCFIQT
jgi:lipoprotein-releasing system permease protein